MPVARHVVEVEAHVADLGHHPTRDAEVPVAEWVVDAPVDGIERGPHHHGGVSDDQPLETR